MYSDKFGSPTTTFIYNDIINIAAQHEVEYLCVSKGNADFKYDKVNVIPFQRNTLTRKIHSFSEQFLNKMSFYNREFYKRVNDYIDNFRPDIIQCYFGIEALRLIDNLSEKNRSIPITINFLGYDASLYLSNRAYVKRLKQLASLSTNYAISNCNFLKQNLEKAGVQFKNHSILYTGVDTKFFSRNESNIVKQDKITFANIAVLSYRKGQEITLKAFSKFLHPQANPSRYKLVLGGGAEFEEDEIMLKQLATDLKLENNVSFLGWVSQEQSRKILQQSTVYVHHSRTHNGRTEGLPTIISEAMAMELPVISTYHAAIPEQIEDGVNGFLVNENDVEMYAQKMQEIISWPQLSANREKVIQLFSIDTRITKLLSLYSQIKG